MISTDVRFGDIKASFLGLLFTSKQIGYPDLKHSYIDVPGRSPLEYVERRNGVEAYNNRTITINFEYLDLDWADERRRVSQELHGKKCEISFDDDPGWFYTGRLSAESAVNGTSITFTVTATCEPFKMSTASKETFTAGGTITNPSKFTSFPLIRVYGTGDGAVTIGNDVITITGMSEYIDIDSDTQDCYKDTLNCNDQVSLGSTGFPVLQSGGTGISFSGAVTKIEITPRWRTL